MRLSVCIPTHHGRCVVLREALDSIAAQAVADLPLELEIVISDNAAEDGTGAMVAEFHAEHPTLLLTYFRNERDLGLENILLAAERATGDWCWLFGSDDLMAEDGLRRLMDTIVRYPDATGVGFLKANFSNDMTTRLEADAPDSLPVWRETRLLTDDEEILVELSLVHCFMGTNAVRRDRWIAAARDRGRTALTHPDWPQLVILETMARRDPSWIWLPAWLVKARAGAPYLTESDSYGPDLTRMHERLVAGLDRVWGELAGRGSPLHQRLMRRAYAAVGSSYVVANLKDNPRHGLRGDLRLLIVFTRAFWRLPEFRRHAVPRLLVPAPLWRALRRRQLSWRGAPMPALPGSALRTTVTCELPETLLARDMPRLRCRVRNDGPVALRSVDPYPVAISYRFFGADGVPVVDGLRALLRRPLEPGAEVEVVLRVLTPWVTGVYELRVGPVQELVAWLDDLDRANGAGRTVRVVDAA